MGVGKSGDGIADTVQTWSAAVDAYEATVTLIAPTLFGVFIELAALAFGFFGFRLQRCVFRRRRTLNPIEAGQ